MTTRHALHPRFWGRRVRGGVAAGAVLVLALNAIALLTGAAHPVDDQRDVAVAAVSLAGTAATEDESAEDVGVDLDPLAGMSIAEASVHAPAGAQVDLPVPEMPPADPYAPTPEIRHGQLEIPSIGLSQPFFEGVTLTAINRGPSHWPGTAMPGEVGNVVIAGHRTTYSRPFWDLQAVQPGDELIFTMNDGTRHVYVADGTEVVDDSDVHIIDQTPQRTATLFACHPRGSARQRIVGHFTLRPETRTVQVFDTHQVRAPSAS